MVYHIDDVGGGGCDAPPMKSKTQNHRGTRRNILDRERADSPSGDGVARDGKLTF